MVALMVIAAVVGDALNYTIGRLFGEKLFSNPNSKIFRRSYLDKTHTFYERHGGKTIIGSLCADRQNLCAVCGGNGSHVLSSFCGVQRGWRAAVVLLFTYAGYLFGDLPIVQENLKLLIVAIIVLSVLPALSK